MIDLSLLTDGGVGWLDASGPSSHLVLSTRIRLARNLAGHVFQGRNSETEREDILAVVERAARESVLLRRATRFRLDRLERTDRQLLHERHLVSKELAGLDADGRVRSGASLLVQDRIGVMLNEEDHLRIQGLHSGFALEAAYAEVDRLDAELGQRLAFAFHPEFGYLTSCPTNVGTGLRASVLIHLPGLGAHQGNLEGAAGPGAGGADVPRAVRGGQRGRRQLLPAVQPDHAGQFRARAARPSGQDGSPGDGLRGAGAAGAAAGRAGDHRGQGLAGVRAAALCPGALVRRGDEPVESACGWASGSD